MKKTKAPLEQKRKNGFFPKESFPGLKRQMLVGLVLVVSGLAWLYEGSWLRTHEAVITSCSLKNPNQDPNHYAMLAGILLDGDRTEVAELNFCTVGDQVQVEEFAGRYYFDRNWMIKGRTIRDSKRSRLNQEKERIVRQILFKDFSSIEVMPDCGEYLLSVNQPPFVFKAIESAVAACRESRYIKM